MEKTGLAAESVPLGRLFCSPANPRRNDEAVPHVAASLRRFGWQQPIVAKPSGEVIAGNTRLKAAQSLGMTEVPVVWFAGTDLDAVAYAVADNRSHEFSTWIEEDLAKLLQQLRTEDALDGVGYESADIDALLDELGAGAAKTLEDPGPQPLPVQPATRHGDIWLLGGHRLACGDAREASTVTAALPKDRLADLVWTDPPYGVEYEGKTDRRLRIDNDHREVLQPLLRDALGVAHEHCRAGAVWYVAAPSGPQFLDFAVVLQALGVWRQTLAWVKQSLVMGHSDFHYRHEAILYGWVDGAAHRAPPDRTHDTVWEIDRPTASREHPTMKPVELVQRALELSSLRGDVVLDCFAGSGTTAIAAEITSRRAALVELDPAYADVIVARWQTMTGNTATLEATGQTFAVVRTERLGTEGASR